MLKVAFGEWPRSVSTFAAVALLSAAGAVPAKTAQAVTVKAGHLAPSGVAELAGKLPKTVKFQPKSYALSHTGRFTAAATVLDTTAQKAAKGRFLAWVGLRDDASTGHFTLLGCKVAKPSRSGCKPLGTATVGAAPRIPAAIASLDTAHIGSATFGIQGGILTVTGADGTTYTLNFPEHGPYSETVTMTPVTALTPASAVGRLVDGVVISPSTEAPAGTTLEIKRAAALGVHAHAVAFGDVDPSGGAFPLPATAGADTTIAVSEFGGYGLAVPATGAAADRRPVPVRCERPLTASQRALASAAGSGSRPLMSCISAAQRDTTLSNAIAAAASLSGAAKLAAIYAAFETAAEPIADEMLQIINAPPTDVGAAELEQLSILGGALERQSQLSGVPEQVMSRLHAALVAVAEYSYNLVRMVCLKAGSQPSDIYISYMQQALNVSRELEVLSSAPADIASVILTCANRIRLQLVATDDATVDHSGQWTDHVAMTDTATITSANLQFSASNTMFTFASAQSQAEPSFVAVGGSTTMTSETGALHPEPMGVSATRRVHCDRNRTLTVERHTYLAIGPPGIWGDHENVSVSDNGVTLPKEPEQAADVAWAQDYPAKSPQLKLEIGGDPFTRSDSGMCSGAVAGDFCTTFAYNASLTATALSN